MLLQGTGNLISSLFLVLYFGIDLDLHNSSKDSTAYVR